MKPWNRKYARMPAAALIVFASCCPLQRMDGSEGQGGKETKSNPPPENGRFSKEQEIAIKHLISNLRSPYSKRKAVADKLAAYGKPVLKYILPELKTNDSIMHLGTIDVLKALGDAKSIDRLIEIVERDEKGQRRTKTDVRVYAAGLILQLGTQNMKNRVIQTLEDKDGFYVKELIKLLGKNKIKKAISKIADMSSKNAHDLMTAVSVCRSLHAYGNAEAAGVLAGFLTNDDVYLRRLALVLLSENKFGKTYKTKILKCLNSDHKDELEEACRTCGKLKISVGIQRLLELARDPSCSYFVRWEALDALLKIGDKSVTEKLANIKGEKSLLKKAQQVIRKLESG